MIKKFLPKILITTAVAFAAAACGSQQVSDLNSAGSHEQAKSLNQLSSVKKDESILAFAMACAPSYAGAEVRSARILFDSGRAELSLDTNGSESLFTFASSKVLNVSAGTLEVSWPDDQVSFRANLEQGRVFRGELTQGNEVLTLSCYKIVTAERDSDEFSIVCVPASLDQAHVEALNLSIRDVVLSWEDGGLEMIVNPTSQSLIYDFERAEAQEVSARVISAHWHLEQASFHGVSDDGIKFDGRLVYEGQSAVPLVCWKL